MKLVPKTFQLSVLCGTRFVFSVFNFIALAKRCPHMLEKTFSRTAEIKIEEKYWANYNISYAEYMSKAQGLRIT